MEPTPIPVPEELRALAAHDPVIVSALRDARVAIEERSGLDERTIELVRLGTLVALGAPEGSLGAHVRRARGAASRSATCGTPWPRSRRWSACRA